MTDQRRFHVTRFIHIVGEHQDIGSAETFADATMICEYDNGAPVGDGVWFDSLPPENKQPGYVINLPDRNYTIRVEEAMS